MLQARAVRAREQGIKLHERILGDPDGTGRLGTMLPAAANRSCRNKFHRRMMELMLGIHRDKKLPEFASETFEKGVKRNGLPQTPAEPSAQVAIFHSWGEKAFAGMRDAAAQLMATDCPSDS